jgi:hypothetical protein
MNKLLPLAATVGLSVAGDPVLAQIDMTTATSMDGRCRAEIEARTVTCQPVGTIMEFGNGRLAFLFSREGTLYSFSGSRTQPRAQTFVLTVDRVRIASQAAGERDLADAEGECVIQADGSDRRTIAVDCNARSTKQNARYRFVLDHVTNVKRKAFP